MSLPSLPINGAKLACVWISIILSAKDVFSVLIVTEFPNTNKLPETVKFFCAITFPVI